MSSIQKDILDGFFSKLNDLDEIDDDIVTNLKDVLVDNSKPKADDLVKILLFQNRLEYIYMVI